MAESTVSIITDVIRQKLDNAALRLKHKYQLSELQDSIETIRSLLIVAEKQLVENDKVETWQKKLEDAVKANDLMNKDELTGLEAAISKIKKVLSDAQKKQSQNKRVKIWLKELEDEVYDADDLLDEVYNEVLKKVGPVELNSNQLGKLKKIRAKLNTATETWPIRDDDANSSKERHEDQPHKVFTKEFDPNSELLLSDDWMWDHVDAVKKLLQDRKEEKQVEAVAIVGYGGLGKTTLAQQVFVDWEIEQIFMCRIWVNVPYDFKMRSLVEGIIVYLLKMNHYRQLMHSATKREIEKIFMSLVEGVIKSTAKKNDTAKKVENDTAKNDEDDTAEKDEDDAAIKVEDDTTKKDEDDTAEKDEDDAAIKVEDDTTKKDEDDTTIKDEDDATTTDEDDTAERDEDDTAIKDEDDTATTDEDDTAEKDEDDTAEKDDSESVSEVESARNKVFKNFLIGKWDGIEAKIKNAIQTHFNHLDEGQFRKEMLARYTECFWDEKDEFRNELETKMNELKEKLPHEDDDQLHKKLRKEIKGKRLLLVLDDVSNMDRDMWKNFKKLLSKLKVGEGSRIIITTRNKDITSIVDHHHELSNLDENVSWSVFKEIAFPRGVNSEAVLDSSKIKKSAREMVKKCGGNPLALRTLGEKFNSKNLETSNSINLETLPEFQKILAEKILPSLKPSYDFLPPQLKHCFAYCSIFPQQYEIDVKTLIHLWMAQGLIYPQRGQRMEDVGYEYFQNLRKRTLFEEVKDPHDENGNFIVTKCKMPNLIQDLAVFVAGTRLATLNKENEKHSIDRRTQHVSFHFHLNSSWKIPTSFLQAKRIQTIILPCQFEQETERRASHSTCENIISNCKALRTLDLHNTGIDKLPKTIGKLKHLRYLDISQNKAITSLPDSITTLPCLMILKLSKCYGLKELPRNMKRLVHLKHLEIDWCYNLTHMPPGLGELSQLETLSLFALKCEAADHSAQLGELAKLNNLRGELKVQNLTGYMNSGVAKILEKKQHLKSLTLAWKFDENANSDAATGDLETLKGLMPHSNLNELALFGYRSDTFSDWLFSHTNLVKFSLQKCKCKSLQQLSQLSSLKVLILDQMANLKYISGDNSESHSSSSTAFMPSLEELRLTELPKLKGWWADVSTTPTPLPSFPHLSKLLIEDCPKLRFMPLYPNLKEWLVLDNTSLETFIQTMDSESTFTQTMNDASSSKVTISNSKSLPITRNKEISYEDGENDKIKLERQQTTNSESSFAQPIMNDASSSSKVTMNDEMPSHPLSKLQSLPIIGNMEISSEDGENESSSKQTMNDEKRPPSCPLSNLQSLRIIGNKEISSKDGEHHKIKWERLTSLKSLRFDYLPTLMKLLEGLQHVTTLEEIQIWRCDIDTLPEWIGKLESLKTLRLLTCPFLKSLPSGGLGKSLKTLEIVDCPILLQRCQKDTGADWQLIKGIENRLLQQPQSSRIFRSTKESTEEKNTNKQLST